MTNTMIRCHYDGKVFVPDEPVDLQPGAVVNIPAPGAGVFFTGGPGGTMGDLLAIDTVGGWDGIFDSDLDAPELARELRNRAQYRPHVQRALIDLHEHWDDIRLEETRKRLRAEEAAAKGEAT